MTSFSFSRVKVLNFNILKTVHRLFCLSSRSFCDFWKLGNEPCHTLLSLLNPQNRLLWFRCPLACVSLIWDAWSFTNNRKYLFRSSCCLEKSLNWSGFFAMATSSIAFFFCTSVIKNKYISGTVHVRGRTLNSPVVSSNWMLARLCDGCCGDGWLLAEPEMRLGTKVFDLKLIKIFYSVLSVVVNNTLPFRIPFERFPWDGEVEVSNCCWVARLVEATGKPGPLVATMVADNVARILFLELKLSGKIM